MKITNRLKFILLPIVAGVLTFHANAEQGNELQYSDIVSRLYDMKYLSTKPQSGEKSGLFSSWDRGARYDAASDKYVDWFANKDGGGFMDKSGTMMKMDGPGVVWRIWSAKPGKGKLEIFIDGSKESVSPGTLTDMFDTKSKFPYPELVHVIAKGHNFFVPIPFQKSIVIKGGEGWGNYYQITYTKFPDGTKVPSYTGSFSDSDKKALQKANEMWGKRGARLYVDGDDQEKKVSVTIKPGEEKVIASYDSAAAITSLTVDRIPMDRADSLYILRELAISMTWDDDTAPAVWSPLGDFFGTSAGENLYRSLATGMTKEAYYSNWYMPFKKAVIKVKNDGEEVRNLNVTIHTEKIGNADQLLRYHNKWHRDDFSGFDKERFVADRWPDWPVLKVDNAVGRFCGFHTHIWNPNSMWNSETKYIYQQPLPEPGNPIFAKGEPAYNFFISNVLGNGYWWGEGDEKFFVDGEKMPSTFGTGTEDYFGYAWGTPAAFDSALQCQPRNGAADEIGESVGRGNPGNIGHIAMTRWQIPDNIPFQKSFEAVIEKYHGNNWPVLAAYGISWYQSAGTDDYYKEVPVEERRDFYVDATPHAEQPVADGSYEVEFRDHVKIEKGSGKVDPIRYKKMHPEFSGEGQIVWTKIRVGSELPFSFTAREAATGLSLRALKTDRTGGVFEVALDGKKIGDSFELMGKSGETIGEVKFTDVKVSKGPHKLVLKLISLPKGARSGMILDRFKLGN